MMLWVFPTGTGPMVWSLRQLRQGEERYNFSLCYFCELVWPRGKAGKRRDIGSNRLRLSFLFKSCGLWTLSCDFVPHSYETLKWLSKSLITAHIKMINAEVILVVTM